MKGVQIVPEKRMSVLDSLMEEISDDPVFQRAMGKKVDPPRDPKLSEEAVMLGNARLAPWEGLRAHWDAVKTYFGDIRQSGLLRRWQGQGEIGVMANALASVVERVVTGDRNAALENFIHPLQQVVGNDYDSAKKYRVAMEKEGNPGEELGATAAMCIGHTVNGDNRSATEYWQGLMSNHFKKTVKARDGSLISVNSDKITEMEYLLGNGLVMCAAMSCRQKRFASELATGFRSHLHFAEDVSGQIRLQRRDRGVSGIDVPVMQCFAIALGFASMGEYDVWQKIFESAKSGLEKEDVGKSFVVHTVDNNPDARLNMLWLLNECVYGGRKYVPQQMVEV